MEKAGFKRRRKAALLVVLVLAFGSASLVLAFVKSDSATPPWLTVGWEPDGVPGPPAPDYGTIQDAINAATPGWSIVVFPYDFDNEVFPIEVNKTVTLIAKGDVKLDADGAVSVFHVTADDVTIEGFKIEGASRYGINLHYVQNCKIRGNTVEDIWVGIWLYHSHHSEVRDNVVENNQHFGIHLHISDDNIVKSNAVENGELHGICIQNSDGNAILHNTVIGNNHTGIILTEKAHRNEVKGNVVNNNYHVGIYVHGNSHGNAIKDNTVKESGTGIYIYNSDGNAIEDNTATQNTVAIFVSYSNRNVVKENIATHNNRRGNIYLFNSTENEVKDNQASFSTTSHGIYLSGDSDFNVVDGNVAVNNTDAGIKLRPTVVPPTTPDHNTISNNIALYNTVDLAGTAVGETNKWFDNYYDTGSP